MAQTVADILVKTLEEIGVKQIFGLIGDSLNPLADAVSRSHIEWVGVRHEEGAALAAAAQAKLTGKLAVCAGTTGPGSTHLVAGLYEAARDHAPVLAISGHMMLEKIGIEYFQSTKPDLLFRDVSLYTETISSAAQASHVIHEAIAAAYAGRGVAHLTIPQDIMSAKATSEVKSIATLKPREEIPVASDELTEAAHLINENKNIVIMYGGGCRGLARELKMLSDRLHAPLVHSVKGQDIIAYDDPRCLGGLGMIGTKPVYNAVKNCDLLLMIGTDYPYSEYLPEKGNVIQIDERQKILGRRAPTEIGIVGSAGPAIRALLKMLNQKDDDSFFKKVNKEREDWDKMLDKQADIARDKNIIHPQAVARTVSDLAQPDAIFVFDTGLNTLWSANWIKQNGKQRIIGSFNNAAVGTALGQANGVQALDRSRQVIVLSGDGGCNMLIGEFMTSVHNNLPIKIVIYNNSSFGLITLEAEAAGLPAYKKGIDFPNPDFAALAVACGAQGFTVTTPEDLKDTLAKAFSVDGPVIVNVIVAKDEIPNVTRTDISSMKNIAFAKVKEMIKSVKGT